MSVAYSVVPGSGHEAGRGSLLRRIVATLGVPLLLTVLSRLALSSPADILALPISHEVFGGKEDARAFRVGGMYKGQAGPALLQSQGERQASIRAVLRATVAVFRETELEIFLDGDTLLGHLRQSPGDLQPWDARGTLGISEKACEEKFVGGPGDMKREIQKKLGDSFQVVWLSCGASMSGRAAGRIADRATGFFVDIFSYRADKGFLVNLSGVCPENLVFPLRQSSFMDTQVLVPYQEEAYLGCHSGRKNLDPPLWPIHFLVYASASWLTALAVLACVALLSGNDKMEISAFAVSLVGKNGLQLACFAYMLYRQSSLLEKIDVKPIALLAVAWTLLLFDSYAVLAQAAATCLEDLVKKDRALGDLDGFQ